VSAGALPALADALRCEGLPLAARAHAAGCLHAWMAPPTPQQRQGGGRQLGATTGKQPRASTSGGASPKRPLSAAGAGAAPSAGGAMGGPDGGGGGSRPESGAGDPGKPGVVAAGAGAGQQASGPQAARQTAVRGLQPNGADAGDAGGALAAIERAAAEWGDEPKRAVLERAQAVAQVRGDPVRCS
jgi:hypothetical protein